MKSNLQAVKDHYAASSRNDASALMSDVSSTVRWTEMDGFPCAGTWFGPTEVMDNVFQVLATEWENYQFTLDQIIDSGNILVGIGTYSGTYRSTGKHMRARAAHVWHVLDGEIMGFEQFTDTALVSEAMRM